jgi:hypothetical protein
MKKSLAFLIIACVFALLAEDPKIEVIPIAVTTELSKTKKLSDRKELEVIGKHPPGSVSVAYPYSGIKSENQFSLSLKVAFIGEVQNLKLKEIKINDIIKTGMCGNSTLFNGGGANQYKGLLTAPIFLHSSSIKMFPKKIEKIDGMATLEKYSAIKFEIKNILSMDNKTFTNKKLQEKGIKLKFKNVNPDCFQTTILSTKKIPVNYEFTFTEYGKTITGVSQPKAFRKLHGEGSFSETSSTCTGGKSVSIMNGEHFTTSLYEVNGNKLIVNKVGLSKDSALKMEIKTPEKEFKIPFCFENIELP